MPTSKISKEIPCRCSGDTSGTVIFMILTDVFYHFQLPCCVIEIGKSTRQLANVEESSAKSFTATSFTRTCSPYTTKESALIGVALKNDSLWILFRFEVVSTEYLE